MFILRPDKKSLIDERGNGYYVKSFNDDFIIKCYGGGVSTFKGTEQECLDRMLNLAFMLDAQKWHSTGVLRSCNQNSMINVVLSCLDSIKQDDAALDALAHTAAVLARHPSYAGAIEDFVGRMEQG